MTIATRGRNLDAGVGLLAHDARRRPAGGAGGDGGPDLAGDADVMHRTNALGLDRDDRASIVRGLANMDVERDLAEPGNAAQLGFLPRAAMAEDRRDLVAGRAAEARHVFDQPEQRDVDLLEHRDGAPRVDQGDVLRRRDDDGTG